MNFKLFWVGILSTIFNSFMLGRYTSCLLNVSDSTCVTLKIWNILYLENFLILLFQDRAKIQSKRRPPSRQARKSAAMSSSASSDDMFNAQSSPVTSPSSSGSGTSPVKSQPETSPVKTSQGLPDLDFDPSRIPPPISGFDFCDTVFKTNYNYKKIRKIF